MLRNLTNQFFFTLRNSLAFSRKLKYIKNQPKTSLFKNESDQNLEKDLLETYNLNLFHNNSTIITYKENLYILKLLQDTFNSEEINVESENMNILDIGSRNFSYATSLQHFFLYYNSPLTPRHIFLDGIEIDPNRLMADLHTRKDYAQYYIENLVNTRYLTEDFLNYNEKQYNFITWFLPFLTPKPLLQWGLPLQYLKPNLMLEHSYSLLAKNGYMIILNQSSQETKIQMDLLEQKNILYKLVYESYSNCFSPFKNHRSLILIKKN